jgi:hypothetical protein
MSNSTRNYLKDFDYRSYAHTASASQFSTFFACPRQWWFKKVLRIPEVVDQKKFIFGNLLHDACERFLLTDDNGKGPELWPDGWSDGLSGFEANILRRLVEEGIKEGILRRTPGRRIEAPFQYEIVPGVSACGYRDVAVPGLVEDHKSIKLKRYRSTRDDLFNDPQLRLYAAVDIRERVEVGDDPALEDPITLRHNQFIKDPDNLEVLCCEVDISVGEVIQWWEDEIEPAAEEMLRLKRAKLSPQDWQEVIGPLEAGACRAYGGCPFHEVCSGVMTPQALCAKIERINSIPKEPDQQESPKMKSVFKRNRGSAPAKPARTPKPRPADEPVSAEEIPTEPPWAQSDCAACGGSGFNSKGDVCAACDRTSVALGGPVSVDFSVRHNEDGSTEWLDDDGDVVGCVTLTSPVKVKEDTKPLESKPKRRGPGRPKKQDVEPEAVNAKAKKVGIQPIEEPKSKGKAVGWTLVYGAVRRAKKMLDLNLVFATYAEQLAEELGAESYYEIDRFKRGDLMASKAGEIAATIKTNTVVTVRADSQDIRKFVAAMEPYAANVVEGTG